MAHVRLLAGGDQGRPLALFDNNLLAAQKPTQRPTHRCSKNEWILFHFVFLQLPR